jgi:hypothetical protein
LERLAAEIPFPFLLRPSVFVIRMLGVSEETNARSAYVRLSLPPSRLEENCRLQRLSDKPQVFSSLDKLSSSVLVRRTLVRQT